jgi:hypothetical protein
MRTYGSGIMNKMRSSRCLLLAFFPLFFFMAASPAEAAKRPFKAPPGTVVEDQSTGNDVVLWRIYYPDYSASAAVGKIKLSAAYRSLSNFKKYIQNTINSDQSYAKYGIKTKLTWRKDSYVLSGSSSQYRVYLKGRLGKDGYWHFGSMSGKRGAKKTAALEKMIAALK